MAAQTAKTLAEAILGYISRGDMKTNDESPLVVQVNLCRGVDVIPVKHYVVEGPPGIGWSGPLQRDGVITLTVYEQAGKVTGPAASEAFSVIYEADGDIHRIGPFGSEDEANLAARKAQDEGEFDIRDQRAYLMYPDHRMLEYSMQELGVGIEDDEDDDS